MNQNERYCALLSTKGPRLSRAAALETENTTEKNNERLPEYAALESRGPEILAA